MERDIYDFGEMEIYNSEISETQLTGYQAITEEAPKGEFKASTTSAIIVLIIFVAFIVITVTLGIRHEKKKKENAEQNKLKNAQHDIELAKLELEAAKLRSEAAKLQPLNEAKKESNEPTVKRGFDRNNSPYTDKGNLNMRFENIQTNNPPQSEPEPEKKSDIADKIPWFAVGAVANKLVRKKLEDNARERKEEFDKFHKPKKEFWDNMEKKRQEQDKERRDKIKKDSQERDKRERERWNNRK